MGLLLFNDLQVRTSLSPAWRPLRFGLKERGEFPVCEAAPCERTFAQEPEAQKLLGHLSSQVDIVKRVDGAILEQYGIPQGPSTSSSSFFFLPSKRRVCTSVRRISRRVRLGTRGEECVLLRRSAEKASEISEAPFRPLGAKMFRQLREFVVVRVALYCLFMCHCELFFPSDCLRRPLWSARGEQRC